jgi:hypothetical protein
MRPIESLLLRGVNPALIFRGGVGGRAKTLLICGVGSVLGQKGHLQPVEAHFGVQKKTQGKKDARRARVQPGGGPKKDAARRGPGTGTGGGPKKDAGPGATYFCPAFFFGGGGKGKNPFRGGRAGPLDHYRDRWTAEPLRAPGRAITGTAGPIPQTNQPRTAGPIQAGPLLDRWTAGPEPGTHCPGPLNRGPIARPLDRWTAGPEPGPGPLVMGGNETGAKHRHRDRP